MSVIVSGAALSLASLAFLVYDFVTFREGMVRRLSTQADIIGYSSASSLLFRDEQTASQTLAALQAKPDVTSAAIYNQEGQRFATYARNDQGEGFQGPLKISRSADAFSFEKQHLDVWRRITFQNEWIGTVYIRSDLDELYGRLVSVTGIGFVMFSLSTLVALLVSSRLQGSISGPATQMAEVAKNVAQRNDYSVRVPETGRADEMGALVTNFNEMLFQIQERDEALHRAHQEVERKVLERTEELRATNANLEAVNRELEAFSYSVSHDLRAPLRAIDGFSRILLEDYGSQLGEDGSKQLLRVCRASQRMGDLIDDLLNLSRVTRNEMVLDSVDLSDLAHRVTRELQNGEPDRAVELVIEPGLQVQADPHLTRAILANLIGNAWKFTRKKPQPKIELGMANQNGQIAYFVRDNGAGFDMAYADKLFGAFQRLHRADEFEGTGIGLATVQRIIRRHGGRVWAESTVDQGATFYFTL